MVMWVILIYITWWVVAPLRTMGMEVLGGATFRRGRSHKGVTLSRLGNVTWGWLAITRGVLLAMTIARLKRVEGPLLVAMIA